MKIILLTAIIATSFATAFLIIHKENIHCKTLRDSVKLLTEIKNNAILYSESFNDIVFHLNKNNTFSTFDFIEKHCDLVLKEKTAPDAWRTAVEISKCNLYQWEKDVIIRFGELLCSCSRTEIAEYSDSAITELMQYSDTAREKRAKNAKTSAVFALSTGIMIVLVLI